MIGRGRRLAAVWALALVVVGGGARPAAGVLYEDGAGVLLGWRFCLPGAACAYVEHPELYRTGMWWPCWAVDQPCSEEG